MCGVLEEAVLRAILIREAGGAYEPVLPEARAKELMRELARLAKLIQDINQSKGLVYLPISIPVVIVPPLIAVLAYPQLGYAALLVWSIALMVISAKYPRLTRRFNRYGSLTDASFFTAVFSILVPLTLKRLFSYSLADLIACYISIPFLLLGLSAIGILQLLVNKYSYLRGRRKLLEKIRGAVAEAVERRPLPDKRAPVEAPLENLVIGLSPGEEIEVKCLRCGLKTTHKLADIDPEKGTITCLACGTEHTIPKNDYNLLILKKELGQRTVLIKP